MLFGRRFRDDQVLRHQEQSDTGKMLRRLRQRSLVVSILHVGIAPKPLDLLEDPICVWPRLSLWKNGSPTKSSLALNDSADRRQRRRLRHSKPAPAWA